MSERIPFLRNFMLWLLTLTVLSAGHLRAQIEKESEELTNVKRLTSNDLRTLVSESYPGHSSFLAEYEVRQGRDTTWRISIFGFSENQTVMHAQTDLQFHADGDTIKPADLTSKLRSMDASIIEIKHVTLSRSDFEKLATAEKVTADVRPYQFTFTYPLHKDLRSILDRASVIEWDKPVASEDSVSGD